MILLWEKVRVAINGGDGFKKLVLDPMVDGSTDEPLDRGPIEGLYLLQGGGV